MDLNRIVPVAGALLLVASTLGAPALAETDSSDGDASTYCERAYDENDPRREQCKQAYSQEHSDSNDSTDSSDDEDDATRDCTQYDDPRERQKCEEYWQRSRSGSSYDDGQSGRDDGSTHDGDVEVSPLPVVQDLPASVAPDVEKRRQFFQEQAREHRDFHRQQQEERRNFFENQSEERRAFVTDLTDRCMNRTAWGGQHAANMTREQIRDGLETFADNRTECIQEFQSFVLEQQDEREELLDQQRQEHREFHERLDEERLEFLQEQRQAAEERAEQRHQEWEETHDEEMEEAPGQAGRFQASDGSVDGRYVSFNYTADPAALADVSVKGIPVFEAAALDGSADQRFRGAGFALAGDNGTLMIHDNPAVAFQIHPEDDGTWVLNLASHLNVSATEDEERWKLTDGDRLHGFLLFEDDPAYDPLNMSFEGDDSLRFIVVPEEAYKAAGPDASDEAEDGDVGTASEEEVSNAVRDAMVKGTLGAEVNLASAENGSVEDDTVLYDDLEVALTEKEKGKVRFVVDGELETGRTVIVNAEPGLFEGEGLSITYEDIYENGTTEEVPIRLASTVQDVMNPNDDSTPEYLPAEGAEGWQVMVSFPHFSAHAVTIQSVTSQAPPSVMAGALAAVGFLVLAGGNLFRRGGRP